MVNDFAPVMKSSSSLETSQATITMTPEMFALLSSGVYTHKERAVIRELSCNCVDAHKEAGKEDVPFQVHLPTTFEPYFEVRDFGTGLSHEKVMKLYLDYGNSTKNGSNDYIGAMGIGSKSPFAIAQSFTVASYYNGEVRKYSVYMEAGLPQITLLTTNPTTEPNGLAVRVAVADNKRSVFAYEAGRVYAYFPVKPVSNITYDDRFAGLELITKREGKYAAYSNIESYHRGNGTKASVIMGNIEYPISINELYDVPRFFNDSVDKLDIYLPIGSVAITASREALQMNDTTKEKIVGVIEDLIGELIKDTLADLASKPTIYEAAQAYCDLRSNSRGMFDHISNKVVWGGVKLKELELELEDIRRDYFLDDQGQKILDDTLTKRYGVTTYKKGYQRKPLLYYRYGDLKNRIRATKLQATNESAHLSFFDGAKLDSLKKNTIFIINDRLNKNGTVRTVYNNNVTLAIMEKHKEAFNVSGYFAGRGLIAYYFESEADLQAELALHKLESAPITIYKMSDFIDAEPKRAKGKGKVKLIKVTYEAETGDTYTNEADQDLDSIEEPQLYLLASGDTLMQFKGDVNGTARILSRFLKKDIYIFRKANWKKVPEDWTELNDDVVSDAVTSEHWKILNRAVLRDTMYSYFDIRDYGVVCLDYKFEGKKINEGSSWKLSDKVDLINNKEQLTKMFGKFSYICAPILYEHAQYSIFASGLSQRLLSTSPLLERMNRAKKRMEKKAKIFVEKFKEENFLLSNLDWGKVDLIKVSEVMGVPMKSVAQEREELAEKEKTLNI